MKTVRSEIYAFLLTALAMIAVVPSLSARHTVEVDTLTMRRAITDLPVSVMEILPREARMQMANYYWKNDSIYRVRNSMEGFSYLLPPVTQNYAGIRLTPVSNLYLRRLPLGHGNMLVTAYTIGSSRQAPDSELRFYDSDLHELKRSKYIRLARAEDFLMRDSLSGKEYKELLGLIPFPTVEYILSPESNDLKARLTVGEYLGEEDYARIKPHLRTELTYLWTGRRYELQK